MVRAIRGVLVECDPAIKSIIVNIDSENHDFIIEDLDEERLVINENMMEALKRKLEEVSSLAYAQRLTVRLLVHPCSHTTAPKGDPAGGGSLRLELMRLKQTTARIYGESLSLDV